jgi:glutamyl-tRNA synthetase
MVNFLALLGWSLDDQTQVMSRDEMVRSFSIERIGKAGAVFDQERLDWMNGYYIRELTPQRFINEVRPFLEDGLPAEVSRPVDVEKLLPIAPLLQERLKTLKEAPEMMAFFFVDGVEYEPETLVQRKMDRESTVEALRRSLGTLKALASFDAESLESVLRPLAEELGLKAGQLFGVLRIAVTGRKAAPPLFEVMQVVGRDRCLDRVQAALEMLG